MSAWREHTTEHKGRFVIVIAQLQYKMQGVKLNVLVVYSLRVQKSLTYTVVYYNNSSSDVNPPT